MLPPSRSTRTITLAELQGAGCYLLHYTAPYMGRPSAPPRHYLGWARCIGRRITERAQGKGAHFTKAVHEAGIAFEVAAIWPGGTRQTEKALKRRHHRAELCPICREAYTTAAASAKMLVTTAVATATMTVTTAATLF